MQVLNRGLLDEFDNGVRNRSPLAVEANDETCRYVEPGGVYLMDALGDISSRILLFLRIAISVLVSGLSIPTKTPMKLA